MRRASTTVPSSCSDGSRPPARMRSSVLSFRTRAAAANAALLVYFTVCVATSHSARREGGSCCTTTHSSSRSPRAANSSQEPSPPTPRGQRADAPSRRLRSKISRRTPSTARLGVGGAVVWRTGRIGGAATFADTSAAAPVAAAENLRCARSVSPHVKEGRKGCAAFPEAAFSSAAFFAAASLGSVAACSAAAFSSAAFSSASAAAFSSAAAFLAAAEASATAFSSAALASVRAGTGRGSVAGKRNNGCSGTATRASDADASPARIVAAGVYGWQPIALPLSIGVASRQVSFASILMSKGRSRGASTPAAHLLTARHCNATRPAPSHAASHADRARAPQQLQCAKSPPHRRACVRLLLRGSRRSFPPCPRASTGTALSHRSCERTTPSAPSVPIWAQQRRNTQRIDASP